MAEAYGQEHLWTFGLMSWLALGLFIGATGKSAQIPLYIWLPDAMAGPTPVSALIHAATMVTAGVFMLTRTNFIFQRSVTMMFVVALSGCLTGFVAATIGITQTDIKKVLAYSTVSQLGYMFMGAGVGAFVGAIFHVFTHAFFKALLFLGAGSVIHGMHHEQEMPRMGGLAKYMPITYRTMWLGWLASCGIPPLAGFFSKDEILWKTYSTGWFNGKVFWFIGFVTAGITAFYMTRLMALTFWGKERFKEASAHDSHSSSDESHGHHHEPVKPHESPGKMTVPLVVLAVGATVVGLIGIPHASVFERWLEPVIVNVEHPRPGEPEHISSINIVNASPATEAAVHAEAAHEPLSLSEILLMGLSIAMAFGGILLARLVYLKRTELADIWAAKLRPLYTLSMNKWYWDYLLDVKAVEAGKAANNALWQVDKEVVDGGVNGAGWLTRFWAGVSGFWDKWVIDWQ
jgi:NADH-quinone oxidoreductase subunit L